MRKVNMLPALYGAKRCYRLDLQLFGEGTGGAAAAVGTGETTGETPAGSHTGGQESGRDAAAPDTQNQAAAEQQKTRNLAKEALPSAPDKTAEFEKLIRGEYKEQFAAKTQRILSQRFKENKTQAAQAEENTRLSAARREDAARQICREWARQGESLKEMYPKFDFGSEAKNPVFAALLKAGVPVKNAYEATHLEQVLGGAMQYTADRVSAAVMARMAARAARPAENGMTSRAGAVMKRDVGQLTREERESIERRVAHGEHIRF